MANQKRHYQHCVATHKFQVEDLVLLKKHNAEKIDLWWEPNYRVVRLKSPWSAMAEKISVVKQNTTMLVALSPNTPQKTGH